jgi:hypothetical protein
LALFSSESNPSRRSSTSSMNMVLQTVCLRDFEGGRLVF